MLPSLTVIICTYNRAFIIGECLESLVRQTTALETFEILLVDNNSNDETQKVAASYVHKLPNLKIAEELQQGLSHARNRGVAEAQTEWIAFLDDDAKARPDWVETILATIAKDDFDAFGGPYYAWHRSGPPPAWLPDDFGTYRGLAQYGPLKNAYIPGGNCAFKKAAAVEAGNFPTEAGMAGKKCAYGEETLFFNRMESLGYRLGFVPDMAIDHCVLPYKYTIRWQLRSALARGKSWQMVADPNAPLSQIPSLICPLVASLLKFPLKFIYKMWKNKGRYWQKHAIDCVYPIFHALGKISVILRKNNDS